MLHEMLLSYGKRQCFVSFQNDVAEDLEDDDDEDGAEEGKEDPNPLCSDDDVSDDEPAELFETENVVVCQYDKVETQTSLLSDSLVCLLFLRSRVRKTNGDLF